MSTIELTEQQCQAVKNGEAVRLTAAEVGGDVVLLQAKQYESIRELLEDEREQAAFSRFSIEQARKIAQEDPY